MGFCQIQNRHKQNVVRKMVNFKPSMKDVETPEGTVTIYYGSGSGSDF